MLIEPMPGHCLVVAAQNTNHMPGYAIGGAGHQLDDCVSGY
jgi:hypothetical protein